MNLKLSKIILLVISLIFFNDLFGQERVSYGNQRYYPIQKDLLHSSGEKNKYSDEIAQYITKCVDAEKIIKNKNWNEDLTSELQTILDIYDSVILPNREMKVNEKGLRLNSGQILIFQKRTILKSIPNNKTHFAVLIIEGIKNIKIYNPKIIGERFEHRDNKGQWGMGIRITGSENIKIYNPEVKEMWGDGIYIGGKNKFPSKNIDVYNAHLDNNRRNALSITSADGVRLVNPLLANSSGQNPKAGIDIEPNNNDDIIDNIFIDNPISYYNSIYGIVIALTRFSGIKSKEVKITINNPLVIGGKYGVAILGIYDNPLKRIINGNIKIKNLTTYYTASTIKRFLNPQFDIKIDISNMKIYHKSKKGVDYFNQKQLNEILNNIKNLNGG